MSHELDGTHRMNLLHGKPAPMLKLVTKTSDQLFYELLTNF